MASTKRLKLTSSSSSAEKIADNDDLLLQILAFMPVKSLWKFKCVSKNWLSLITDSRFSRRGYLSHSPCICGLFLHYWPWKTFYFSFIDLHCQHSKTLSSVSYPSDMKIIQSCNGFLLCCAKRAEPIYFVCNPTTRQCATLPPQVPPHTRLEKICGVSLAFDPLKSAEYKVISMLRKEIGKPDIQIKIYSSKNGKWRASEARFSLHPKIKVYGGVFWNGGIHWYTKFGPCFYLDVEGEQIKEMPMPNPIPDDWNQRIVSYFGESRGHLYLVENYHPPWTQFDVWELKRDYSGWSLKYRVDLDGLVREYPGMVRDYTDPSELNYCTFQILCIVEGETEEGSYMVLHIPRNIIRYDFMTRNVRKICDFSPLAYHSNEDYWGRFYYCGAYQYIESLVCV